MVVGPVSEARGYAAKPVFQPGRAPARLSKTGPGAVVAGVGEGIGGSIARRAAAAGFTTVMVARNLERLNQIAAAIERAGGNAHARAADLRIEADVGKLFEDVVRPFGTPTLVVFNAGAQYRESILDTTGAMFEKVWRLNCLAGFFVAREAARHMVRKQRGTILAGLPEDGMIKPGDIADTYLWLHRQPRSAWSFEIDLRPWAERF